MGRPINKLCMECSKISFRIEPTPDCYVQARCQRKRNYYRYLDKKREYQRKHHAYIKYSDSICALCKSNTALEVHHINPVLNGGLSTRTNCMTLCNKCHMLITKYYSAIRSLENI